MANLTIYKVEPYNPNYYKLLSGIYNDFRRNASADYNFELEPIDYDNFIKSIEKGLLNCLVLLEDEIPTGFLVYTTLVSESLELNIIHCIGNENISTRYKLMLQKFLELNKDIMKEKVVTYPMLGKQAFFASEIVNLGFKTVNTSVMAFGFNDVKAINKLKESSNVKLPEDYYITNWKTLYQKDVAGIIHQAFKDSYDALFDPRFKTEHGCRDISEKIINNIYGLFLPDITKVLIYKKRPVGICFANRTNKQIANIPIVGILKKHRNLGFGKLLLNSLLNDLISTSVSEGWSLKEINASCDSDNMSSVNMYKANGFTEQYTYPQAYFPLLKN